MVRVGTPSAVARPEWYDRNPAVIITSWGLETGPHGRTVRMSYTVPAGKKAWIEIVRAKVIRQTAATTASYAAANWDITPSGGIPFTALGTALTPVENAVKDKDAVVFGGFMLGPGDLIEGATSDASTGGTVRYDLSYKITQFDA